MATSKHFSNFKRRQKRTRAALATNQQLPRLSVNRSLRHISVQIIDDQTGTTLASASDLTLKEKSNKSGSSKLVGKMIATLAKEKKILKVRFDRGGYKYHGRVAALADAARAEGLQF